MDSSSSSLLSRPPQPVTENGSGTTKQTRDHQSQRSDKAALRVAGQLRSDCRPGTAGSFGPRGKLHMSWTKETYEMMTILKLQCRNCEYHLVQDTKRDPQASMLDICNDIHVNTYRDHLLDILALSRDELEFLVVSKHPRLRRNNNHNHRHYYARKESRSAIFDIMQDLATMERGELENLWLEYGTKE
jgi:hypothetical protein